ncbi:MAG: aminodeoxychorismate lyase [Proteobacteria bacterium]|nr:aminodeoxychorismate lyase [Pseudomonadota bacterium]NOG59391.1 aminodeoxychorismate lyase [Pseudomonadota bacterium]
MALQTLINGQPANEISFLDRGLQYGDGVFETITVQDGTPLCWDEHINRLQTGCQRLSIPFSNKRLLKEEISSLIDSIEPGVIKIIITRGQGGRGYALPDNSEPHRIISLYPFPKYPEENTKQGINARVCNYRYAKNPVLAGIKHLNRLEQVVARSEWSDSTIAEGIVLDQEDNVIEGTMSNVFCVIDNILCTPDLSNCGVEGVIRNKIIELSPNLNIDVEIKKIARQTLVDTDEVFFCNSVIGVWPAKMIDEKPFSVGEKTRHIQQFLQENHFIASLC